MAECFIGHLCTNAAGQCSVMVVGPRWLMDDLARLPGIDQPMPADFLINGVRQTGTVYWLDRGYDPVWVMDELETEAARLLDWDDLLSDVPLVGVEE